MSQQVVLIYRRMSADDLLKQVEVHSSYTWQWMLLVCLFDDLSADEQLHLWCEQD